MANEKIAGWVLVVASVLLLGALNRLDLLAVLLPAAALVGYGIARRDKKSRLTHGLGKG